MCFTCQSFNLDPAGLAACEDRLGRCVGGHRSSAGGRRAAEAVASRIAVSECWGAEFRVDAFRHASRNAAEACGFAPGRDLFIVVGRMSVAALSWTSEPRDDRRRSRARRNNAHHCATLRTRRLVTVRCSRLAGPRRQQGVGPNDKTKVLADLSAAQSMQEQNLKCTVTHMHGCCLIQLHLRSRPLWPWQPSARTNSLSAEGVSVHTDPALSNSVAVATQFPN
jgi:hypothetical protein